MKKVLILIIALNLFGCANIKHLTSTSVADVRGFNRNVSLRNEVDDKVKTITNLEAKKCTFIQDEKAKDNALDSGKEMATYYLKDKAIAAKSNAIVVSEFTKIGDYYYEVSGKVYRCGK